MSDEVRIPEHLIEKINDYRSEDWINQDEAAVLNADRVAGGCEPLNVLQWRLMAILTHEQHPIEYQVWRGSVERICNQAENSEDPLAFP